MEFNILYLIQTLHSEALDAVMVSVFNNIVGSKGEIWVVLGMILLVFPNAILRFNKNMGIVALVFAAMIGFSRMYFFMHFPSDVLLGALLGALIGISVSKCADS